MSEETAMVPVDKPAMPIAERHPGSMIASWQEKSAAVLSSLDVTTVQGKADFLRATGTADRLLKHTVGQTVSVRDWLLHEVNLTDETTGEQFPALRLVLIGEDGGTISTTSEPFMGGFRHVVNMFGQRTFSPPLEITVKAVKGKGPGEYLQIGSVGQKQVPKSAVKKA